ncbi:hypothetical protein EUGRSUZ_J02778 [Eucalyptus grandis]|uniref:Uncharacterized protein n=2 Tax=Eucalyptus grandis TaxID=71139 RepID=A0ACC3JAP6_EUCGR|nr:hypothetical protein EUGRSUZ_J02778 [Eucalyptus grandis]
MLTENLGNGLSNLRYWGLRWTVLDSIPESASHLSLLETSDQKYTGITQLQSSIWKAKNLRRLYMNEVCFDRNIR